MREYKITSHQFEFTIVCYIQAFSMLTSLFLSIAKQSSWLTVLLGTAAAVPSVFMNLYLIRSYPGKNLLEIYRAVYGNKLGTVFSILYVWYFITLCALSLRGVGDFLRLSILPETPFLAVKIPLMLLCCYAVIKGIRTIVRYSAVFAITACIVLVLTTILVIKRMDLHNLLPIIAVSPIKLLQSTNIVATIPLGTSMFLMLAPDVQDQKNISKALWRGFLIGSCVLLLVVLRDIAVLGNLSSVFSLPSYATLRLAGITESLQGIDSVYAVMLIILDFMQISFLFYFSLRGLATLLHMQSFRPLVFVIGILVIVYSFLLYPSSMSHALSGETTVPVYWLLFEYLLPLSTTIGTAIRQHWKKRKEVTPRST